MTYRGDVPLALFKNTETGASSVIAASGSSYDLNCQQCDYKSWCQSHMRQHVKNVHEGFKYSAVITKVDIKATSKDTYKRNILLKLTLVNNFNL